MALKTKQYLENSWYRGASQDRQTGYAAQYQYGYGVNTRDMKNGVCLAGGRTDVKTLTKEFKFFINGGNLYEVDSDGNIYDNEGVLVMTITGFTQNAVVLAETFGKNYVYVATSQGQIHKVDIIGGTSTDVTPTGFTAANCMLNYANTLLLIGCGNKVRSMDTAGTFNKIREFESGYDVMGLTQEGNYLKIYTTDGINTKIHYAKGTFDVEDTGLVQTVSLKGFGLQLGCVTYDQGNDYVLFNTASGEYKLAKVQGYNKIDIKWTQKWGGERVFTASKPTVTACDGIVFSSMDDGIWTFTEYNGWLWGGCCEFPNRTEGTIINMFRYKDYLYVCDEIEDGYELAYYDMSFHPETYQQDGYIISRVFDGGCGSLFKKNVQATVTYYMPEDTSMTLRYRYDRSSFQYSSGFKVIKHLTDYNNCYDIVVPTTDSDFNKTWNYLEYKVILMGNTDSDTGITTESPILFEHSLLYDDRVRKYR